MNRRRIGLGLLAAGAGVTARRKLRRRLEPGVDLPEAVVPEADLPEPDVPEPDLPEGDLAAMSSIDDATASLSSSSLIEQAATTLGSPEIGDPKIGIESEERAEPETPAIVLPTMAAAGTVAVPTADGSAPQMVGSSAVEPPPAMPKIEAPLPTATIADDPPPLPPVSMVDAAQGGSANLDHGSVHWARRRFWGWSVWTLGFVGLLVIAGIAASVIRLPYYRLQPGSVYDTVERVEAPGDLVFLPEGEISFVTVSQTANITPWQWLDAQLDENVRIRHEDEVRGEQTADEARATDLRRMQLSKNSAVVVALQKLGFELIVTPIGVEVAQVFECTAADGTLGTGDLIVGVNGVPTPDGERLVEQLIDAGIGQEVELLVERIDPANPTQSMRTDLVSLTLGSVDDPCLDESVRGEEPRPFIGIGTQTMFEEDLPIDIDVRTGRVGGPSAGLAFTLAIMDVLSEGELTNGLNIVATGTIDRAGNVGPVGGIHQKTIAAERSGADIFLVPMCCDNFVDRTSGEPLDLPTNFEEAQMHADEMLVVGVDTLDDALRAIGELGGDVGAFLES